MNIALAAMTFILARTSSIGVQQGQQRPARPSAAQEFAHAKESIDNANCIDCEGGTQKGLEEGIAEMKRAIEDGYPDKAAAYKLLDDAYSKYGDVYGEESDGACEVCRGAIAADARDAESGAKRSRDIAAICG